MNEPAIKEKIDRKKIPRHVAIIMDGNGRWAKKNGLSRIKGHEAGAKSVRAVTEASRELGGIQSLTLYAFSTENWRRTKTEVSALFRLLSRYIKLELENLHAEGIRVNVLGRMSELPKKLQNEIAESEAYTENNTAMDLNIAVNYGARTELVDVCRSIVDDVESGTLRKNKIDENAINERLYYPKGHDLDLLIRTSGEMRISNFMLWQVSYAELITSTTLWPDFRKRHFFQSIVEYQNRKRNFGGRK
jgi:undecaprenyl diphosphate synthase